MGDRVVTRCAVSALKAPRLVFGVGVPAFGADVAHSVCGHVAILCYPLSGGAGGTIDACGHSGCRGEGLVDTQNRSRQSLRARLTGSALGDGQGVRAEEALWAWGLGS